MTVESMITPQDANVANPAAGDDLSEGDDHLRGIKVMLKKMGWEVVGTATASASASISTYSIQPFVAGYDYRLEADGVYLSASGTLNSRVSTGGGSADSGANYSYSGFFESGGTVSGNNSASTTAWQVGQSWGNATNERGHLSIEIINPTDTYAGRFAKIEAGYHNNSTTTVVMTQYQGSYMATTAIDGLVVVPAAGTITAGNFKLYRRFRPT